MREEQVHPIGRGPGWTEANFEGGQDLCWVVVSTDDDNYKQQEKMRSTITPVYRLIFILCIRMNKVLVGMSVDDTSQ